MTETDTVEMAAAEERAVQCPRCGYDQRGVIESWMEACPLLGVCSECGLKMVWSEVIRPDKYEPRWCVEFRSAGWIVRSAWRTLLLSFRPWRFWHELKMSHDIRWRRIGAYLVLQLLPFLLLYAAEQTAIAMRSRQVFIQQWQQRQSSAAQQLPLLQQQLASYQASGRYSNEVPWLRNLIQQTQAATGQPNVVNYPVHTAVFDAVFTPLSGWSSGSISTAWGVQAFPAPRHIHIFVADAMGLNIRRGPLRQRSYPWMSMLVGQAFILPLFAGIPIGFVLLPISRKRAKVRWRHIGRVTVYSLWIPIAMAYFVTTLGLLATILPSFTDWGWWLASMASNVLIWVALLAWWAIAIWRYLRIPHGWAIAPLLAALTIILLAAVMFYLGFLIADLTQPA
jgi:hypothetical protein